MFESLTRVYENKAALGAGSIKLRGEEIEHVNGLLIVPVLVSEASVFGAEVFGIDWKKPVPDEVVKQVSDTVEITQATRLTHDNSSLSCKTSMLSSSSGRQGSTTMGISLSQSS